MITPVMVDWGAGNYEVTAAELEPVSQLIVHRAALRRGERVVDLACGTGNAALLAALAGTSVVGIDAAPRLLEVGRDRAAAEGVEVEFRLALGRTVTRITGELSPTRFAWSDADAVQPLAARAGLQLDRTTAEQLEIRDASVEDYVLSGREHPMAVAVWPVIEQAGAEAEVHEAMLLALRPANEDPDAFLAHTPYVVHELRAI
jgi:hypothetical protein